MRTRGDDTGRAQVNSGALDEALRGVLESLESQSLLRARTPVRALDAVRVQIGGRTLINFASNNYLGLTHHPRILAAIEQAIRRHGAGAGASGLISGYIEEHQAAESAIAAWKGTESAILLGSGYQANIAAVQAIVACMARAPVHRTGPHPSPPPEYREREKGVRFLIDKLVHASLIDALRSAEAHSTGSGRAPFRVYPHNHMPKLRRLLEAAAPGELQVVMTESIFSMDGDSADLAGLSALREEFGFVLLLDEAHASGVYGPAGRGFAAEAGLRGSVDISVVTFSKALGCVGGAVCGSKAMCDAVVNFGRAYIYSTSVPPATAAGIRAAIEVLHEEPERQKRVRDLARRVRGELASAGYEIPHGDSPIIPIILGTEEAALAAAARLRDAGLLVIAVRPPTVPRGSSRLRITLSSEHTDQQVEQLLAALGRRGQ